MCGKSGISGHERAGSAAARFIGKIWSAATLGRRSPDGTIKAVSGPINI